ncbi:MAG: hypothetical protein ACK51L_04140, partial [bacterium]
MLYCTVPRCLARHALLLLSTQRHPSETQTRQQTSHKSQQPIRTQLRYKGIVGCLLLKLDNSAKLMG